MDSDRFESRRELENLRRSYQEHRRSVRHLLQTAPDSRIASSYEELLVELQHAIEQLDRVDRQPPAKESSFDPNETRAVRPAMAGGRDSDRSVEPETIPANKASFDEAEFPTGSRSWDEPLVRDETADQSEDSGHGSYLAWLVGLIVIVAVIAGIFLSRDLGTVSEPEPALEPQVIDEPVVEEVAPPEPLAVEPASYDYGIIQKGTRSIHRFRIENRSEQVLPLSVERSACRCLWYEHPTEVAPGESVDLAITVDGARAQPGILAETLTVRSDALEDASVSIDLTAEIRER